MALYKIIHDSTPLFYKRIRFVLSGETKGMAG